MAKDIAADFRYAVELAIRAPSLHNSQPWRWRQHGAELFLELDKERWLAATDPDAHGAVLSCGAALELAKLALQAKGRVVEVHEQAERASDRLATIVVSDRKEPDSHAQTLIAKAAERCSDRRPLDGTPALGDFIDEIRKDLSSGTAVHVIHDGKQLTSLAMATEIAEQIELQDPDYRAELAGWTPDRAVNDQGVPASARSDVPGRRSTVPPRSFDLRAPRAHDVSSDDELIERPAFVLVLADGDTRRDWLLAGETTMRIMLRAQQWSLATCALSQPVDRPGDRVRLRHFLNTLTYPQIIIRVGEPMGKAPAPKPTPRRSIDEVLPSAD